ncbi:hypothetical protein ABMA28_004329, partial [Loxostege sticticalis]
PIHSVEDPMQRNNRSIPVPSARHSVESRLSAPVPGRRGMRGRAARAARAHHPRSLRGAADGARAA